MRCSVNHSPTSKATRRSISLARRSAVAAPFELVAAYVGSTVPGPSDALRQARLQARGLARRLPLATHRGMRQRRRVGGHDLLRRRRRPAGHPCKRALGRRALRRSRHPQVRLGRASPPETGRRTSSTTTGAPTCRSSSQLRAQRQSRQRGLRARIRAPRSWPSSW